MSVSVVTADGKLKTPNIELPPPLRSKEEILNYLREQVDHCVQSRVACDIPLPLKGESKAGAQNRLYKVFLMRHGAALGALGFALRTNQIDVEHYAKHRAELQGTLYVTMVGDARPDLVAKGGAGR